MPTTTGSPALGWEGLIPGPFLPIPRSPPPRPPHHPCGSGLGHWHPCPGDCSNLLLGLCLYPVQVPLPSTAAVPPKGDQTNCCSECVTCTGATILSHHTHHPSAPSSHRQFSSLYSSMTSEGFLPHKAHSLVNLACGAIYINTDCTLEHELEGALHQSPPW